MTFVGDELFLADSATDAVRSAQIPVPPTTLSDDPLGMATDGNNIWLAVNATPFDKLMRLDPVNTSTPTSTLVLSFGGLEGVDRRVTRYRP